MRQHLSKWGPWYIVAFAALGTMAGVFCTNGFYDTRVDAGIYADQIRLFSSADPYAASDEALMRIYKPLYAVVGGSILHVADPYTFILVTDIILYLALALVAYAALRLLDFTRLESGIGTAWIITAYPLLKYGLAIGTDVSGWFFSTATVALGLYALRRQSWFLLALASVVGFLGATAQESGALGLILIFLVAMWRLRSEGMKRIMSSALALFLPAAIMYGALAWSVLGQASILGRYSLNTTKYVGYQSFFSLAGVEAASFGILWILIIFGAISWIRDRRAPAQADYLVAAFLATLPVLMWPIFVSRILFIQFLWIVPLALLGLRAMAGSISAWPAGRRRAALVFVCVAPPALSAALFALSAGGPLLDGIRQAFAL